MVQIKVQLLFLNSFKMFYYISTHKPSLAFVKMLALLANPTLCN